LQINSDTNRWRANFRELAIFQAAQQLAKCQNTKKFRNFQNENCSMNGPTPAFPDFGIFAITAVSQKRRAAAQFYS